MRRAPFLTCSQQLIISLIDTKYTQCSIKNSCGKSPTPTFLNVIIHLTKLPLFCNIGSKSNKSQEFGSLNKVQLLDISGIHKDCTLCDAPPYLVSTW